MSGRPQVPPRWCAKCECYHSAPCPGEWNTGRVPGHADVRGSKYGRHTYPIRPFDRGSKS